MGDIAFEIRSNVDINKNVDFDINKDVNANVNNPDQLATAQSDAEAFGENALAETDTYTYVNGEPGPDEQGPDRPGLIDVLGNSINIDTSSGDTDDDGAANTISIDYTSAGAEVDGLPDVDDINGFGVFSDITGPPPIQDDTLPVDGIISITDLNLQQTGVVFTTADGDLEAEYENTEDWVVNLGPVELDLDGDGEVTSDSLILTVPAGSDFIGLYAGPGELPPQTPPDGPLEITFEAFSNGDAVFTHDGVDYDATGFVFTAESLQNPTLGNISDYSFEAQGLFPGNLIPGNGAGESFSYSESVAALDLNSDGDIL